MKVRRKIGTSAAVLALTAVAIGVGVSPASADQQFYRPFSYGLTKQGVILQFVHADDDAIWVGIVDPTRGVLLGRTTLGPLPGNVKEDSLHIGVGNNNLGDLEVYVVGADGNVYHDYSTSPTGPPWSGFSSLGAPVSPIAGDVAVGSNYLGNQELFVRTADGNVYHRFATPGIGSGWSGWDSMGGPGIGIAGDVYVGKNYLKNQELYAIGNDGVLYHDFATPGRGSGWNGWDPMESVSGVAFGSDVNVGINYAGNQELYFLGDDGAVYHNYATPGLGSGWSSFSSLGAPAGVTLLPAVDVEAYDYRVLQSQRIVVYDEHGVPYFNRQTPGTGAGWNGWSTSY